MKSLIKYHAGAYVTSAKFVMPMLLYFLFLVAFYCNAPKTVVSSFAVSAAVLYMLMVWAGFVFSDSEEAISEQVLILKAKSIQTYYTSKIIFLFVFSIFMSLIAIIVPLIFTLSYSLMKGSLFDSEYPLTVISVLIGFLIHIVAGFLGACIGFLFHPRIFRNRKITVIFAMILGVTGFLKGPITEDFAITKFITWLFPPIYNLLDACGKTEVSNVFPMGSLIIAIGISVVYSVVVSIICVITVKKKGF